MEDIARQQISINLEVMDLLNQQLSKEQHSSSVYLAMASWCDQKALTNSAAFFYRQSEEEREHMMKIFKFINDCGGSAYSPKVVDIPHDYASLREIFEIALQQEVSITQSIYKIVAKCRKVNDFATENFLQWFVEEQLEEEQTMRDILDMFDLMGDTPLKFIDERIPQE
ncbi:ferritin [Aquimarina sp. 2201CG5-10]|uniref:ferritin n=1 Tax=Aquimarina callyspongiae TaxID=3098150 RepID=UPI002AB47509|nr:ferritin [Aquimarina sp. 2201CG5-10]MDY8138625.1 ferritin [Aquimarina sp. 2201CG5-10]